VESFLIVCLYTLQLEIRLSRGKVGSINRFFLCVAVPSQDLDSKRHMSWPLFSVQLFQRRWEVIVRFVDIDGTDYNTPFNLFYPKSKW